MWFYVQMWIPLLPIVYVVSCAIDQQTKSHVWMAPDIRSFFSVTSTMQDSSPNGIRQLRARPRRANLNKSFPVKG
jgi:hypothetical protein